jgi:hypothetical protein
MENPWAQPTYKQAQSGHDYVNPTYVRQAHYPWLTMVNAQPPPHSPGQMHG